MISPALVDKAGLTLIGQLTKLSPAEGRHLLGKAGGYSNDEVSELILLCKNSEAPSKEEYYKHRRKALCAMWLLGVSWQQMARIYNVAKPTIIQSAKRSLGDDASRIVAKCAFNRAAEYNAAFWQNVSVLSPQEPRAIAEWLLSNTEVDE